MGLLKKNKKEETPEVENVETETVDEGELDPNGRLAQKAKKLRAGIKSCKDAKSKHDMETELKRVEALLEGE